jgi:hypothetical protein
VSNNNMKNFSGGISQRPLRKNEEKRRRDGWRK